LLSWPACAQDAAAADRNAINTRAHPGGMMVDSPTFKADWQSLQAHRDPEWFRDAKFGIYTHWGPVTVGCEDAPQGGEWYGREMYLTNSPIFAWHRQRFGDQHTFGYKDVIPRFTAPKFCEIHQHTGILDFERGREDRLVPYPWLTDTALGPWFNRKADPYRSTENLIHVLVDIVAKNGCLLLNVGPNADGSIPERAENLLLELGAWLKVNGEAIYGTLRRLVEIGFAGVETAFFAGEFSRNKASQLLKEFDLPVCAAHCALPVGGQEQDFLL
jgi:alpha-L-fucosidase